MWVWVLLLLLLLLVLALVVVEAGELLIRLPPALLLLLVLLLLVAVAPKNGDMLDHSPRLLLLLLLLLPFCWLLTLTPLLPTLPRELLPVALLLVPGHVTVKSAAIMAPRAVSALCTRGFLASHGCHFRRSLITAILRSMVAMSSLRSW